MAFVKEKIPDEDRKKYGIDNRFISWIVDRERNISMVNTGLDKESNTSFWLHYGDETIKFEAKWSAISDSEECYKFYEPQIPMHLEARKIEIIGLLKETIEKSRALAGNPNSLTIKF